MPRAFTLLDSVTTPEGPLELRQRGEQDFMITVGTRVLMSSTLHRSEVAVAELGCAPIRDRPTPRVLIGGLGLGFTLRAALDVLPRTARVEVAELNEAVERWCRGPLAILTKDALSDRRARVHIADVTSLIRHAALAASGVKYDAIVLDLYVGPANIPQGADDPLYGPQILRATHAALNPGGIYAVWAEEPNRPFEERLKRLGFDVELVRPRGGGPRHAVYIAKKSRKPKRAEGTTGRAEGKGGRAEGKGGRAESKAGARKR